MNVERCEAVSDRLTDYLNGRLNENEKIETLRHLADCRECRAELAFLIKIKREAATMLAPSTSTETAFVLIPKPASKETKEKDVKNENATYILALPVILTKAADTVNETLGAAADRVRDAMSLSRKTLGFAVGLL